VLKRAGNLATRISIRRGYTCMLRVNHLQPPFDNPAIRRALLGADRPIRLIDGGCGRRSRLSGRADRLFRAGHADGGDVGLDVFRGPRDMASQGRI